MSVLRTGHPAQTYTSRGLSRQLDASVPNAEGIGRYLRNNVSWSASMSRWTSWCEMSRISTQRSVSGSNCRMAHEFSLRSTMNGNSLGIGEA